MIEIIFRADILLIQFLSCEDLGIFFALVNS